MERLIVKIIILIISFSLVGCNVGIENQMEEGQGNEVMRGFVEPKSHEIYIKPVRQYLHYRTQAVLKGDIKILWRQFPSLQTNSNRNTGINSEKYEVESLNDFTLVDANFSEEGYERIKVKTINKNEVIVLVHGGIGYLRDDFGESGGEILIKLFLENKDNHWTVVKTDEYTLSEFKEWIKDKR
jgi:hypothetical protein